MVSAFCVAILVVYGCHLVGLAFSPSLVAPVAAVFTAVIGWRLFTGAHASVPELIRYLAVVAIPLGWMLWRAAPSLLPLGSQGDLTHHLQLVDYIERHWRLPRGPDVSPYLAEMTDYTPGVHVLAALAGRWHGTDGLHVIHAVVATAVALKIGFVYLMASRLGGPYPERVLLAFAASAFALVPHPYVFDSFMRDGFLPQAMSETFVIGMCWALGVWNASPRRRPMALYGLFACGAFLAWPIDLGPPVVALVGLLVFRGEISLRTRAVHTAWALVPPVSVAATYIAGRSALLGMSGTPGAVLRPDLWTFGPVLPILALLGLFAARGAPSARPTLWLLLGIAAQWSVLYLQALGAGNASAYMAFKTLYLLPYPLATLATVALSRGPADMGLQRLSPCRLASLLLAVSLVESGIRLWRRPPEAHAISEPIWRAGVWARDHLPRGCIAYMVTDDDTAYWLHLAVLRNPRASPRTTDDATYDLTQTSLRWYQSTALPYAIVDLDAVSTSVRVDLEELVRFDTAAVVGQRRPVTCADEHLPPPP